MQDEFGYLPPETSRLPEEPALRETFSMVPELADLPPEICSSDENGVGSDKKRKSKEEKGKQKSLLIKMLSGVLIAGNLVGGGRGMRISGLNQLRCMHLKPVGRLYLETLRP